MNYISIASILFALFYIFNNVNVEGKPLIIGGLPTKPREIKYIVGIFHNRYYKCGGGIIGEKYILTAAHCVVDMSTNELKKEMYQIYAGSDDFNFIRASTIIIDVKTIYVPSVYNATHWGSTSPEADIAVLELKNKLDLSNNKNLQKLELPSDDIALNDNADRGVLAEVAGFGRDSFYYYIEDHKQQIHWDSSRELKKAKVQIVDRNDCQKIYAGNVSDAIICGKVKNYLDGTHQGICSGDSGSPLVQSGTTIIGVFSGSSEFCNDNKWPGIYTKVSSFKKFISDAMQGITDNMRIQIL